MTLLSIQETARRLGVKESTVRSWRLARKHLPFVSVGRAVRVPAAAVEKFVEKNTRPARPGVCV
jgi:excisionase family DNA binding protein